ncbi:MAG TPA: DUF3570 domain-containing protein [Gammaproteobacteria bacterium]|nr:DUF3570 domain-containing protein [Gammaproteobacteria bacterium]
MKSIRNKLAIATCTLLSQGAQQAAATDSSWTTNTSYLFYSEADNRVTVHKIITNADVTLGDSDVLSLEAVYDTVTGATPTGAVKSVNTVSVTTPSSGGNGFATAAGTPDLVQFDDTRLGVNVGWAHNYNRTLKVNYGASVSVERDYEAYGGSLTVNKETSDRSLTFTAGVAGSYDTIFQSSGGTPKPMGDVKENNYSPQFFGEGNKRSYQGILGVSRILNRRTVAEFNYTIGALDGYLTDPYKLISMTDTNGVEMERYFESRPDSRLRQTVYGGLVHRLDNKDTIHLSYRFYWDDWDINSHTINYRHRRNLSDGRYLEPHLRIYHQTAADFFHHSLKYGQPLPEYASADYRLDEMSSLTLGAKYGLPAWGGTLRFRLEYLYQSFSEAEYDTNKALIFQASYKKEFD